ncbi:MAG TPA: APC family permease [Vicinamibacterales bacterium]|nr:APC family permease [Vicinamibacterales bacterium]
MDTAAKAVAGVAPPPRLIRAIGRWGLTAVVINGVIGSGIFGLPSSVASMTGASSPIAILIAGASIFVIVLCFAEVGSRFDDAGGPYLYTREAFGPAVGFEVGWLHIWTRLLSAAAVLNVFASYLAALVPWFGTSPGRAIVITLAVVLVTTVNVAGVRLAAGAVNVFTVAKLLPLMGLVAFGIFQISRPVLDTQQVVHPRWTEAVLLLVFGFGGFESGVVAGSESCDPKRDTAFALISSMAAVTMIYVFVQITVVGVLPHAAESQAPIGAALGMLFGPSGITLGTIAVLLSVYGWLTGFALMSPRIIFSMAERGELPRFMAHVNERSRVPDTAIVVNSVIALALGLAGDFGQLATFAAIAKLGIYATTCGALIVFRRRHGLPQGYRAPCGPALAVTGIAFCLWLLSTRSLGQAWFMPIMLTAGAAIWWATTRMRAVS